MSNKAILNVNHEPKIIDGPHDLGLLKDKEANSTCIIFANPKPTVTWYQNTKQLTTKDGFKFISDDSNNKYTFTIPKLLEKYGGIYTVKASNNYGNVEKTFVIEVFELPKVVNKLPNMMVCEGDRVDFLVSFKGNPKPDIKWFRNDEEIILDEKFEVNKSNISQMKFSIICCQSHIDSGTYHSKVFNQYGESLSNQAILIINS